MPSMEEEEKPKEEPELDAGKPTRKGGYTIPVQSCKACRGEETSETRRYSASVFLPRRTEEWLA